MTGVKTQIPETRDIPLNQLAERSDWVLRRIVPRNGTNKAPVATFDASL